MRNKKAKELRRENPVKKIPNYSYVDKQGNVHTANLISPQNSTFQQRHASSGTGRSQFIKQNFKYNFF